MIFNKNLKNVLLIIFTTLLLSACSTAKKAGTKGEGFTAKLWSIDITGYNERQLKTETDASDPSWSSLLSK